MREKNFAIELEQKVYDLYEVLGTIECVEILTAGQIIADSTYENRALMCAVRSLKTHIVELEKLSDALRGNMGWDF